MLGVVYLVLCVLIGFEIIRHFLPPWAASGKNRSYDRPGQKIEIDAGTDIHSTASENAPEVKASLENPESSVLTAGLDDAYIDAMVPQAVTTEESLASNMEAPENFLRACEENIKDSRAEESENISFSNSPSDSLENEAQNQRSEEGYINPDTNLENKTTTGILGLKSGDTGNMVWIVFPAAFGFGTLVLTWAVYAVSWIFSVYAGEQNPLFYGNLITMFVAAIILAVCYYKRDKKAERIKLQSLVSDKKLFKKETVLFAVMLVFITWILFYVFHVKDGVLYSGYTVFSDYSPHLAMIRSFSFGNNFPTQYPHFGGEDVKYHFMFQFLAGNMEYLGMRLDFAYNIVSILSLLGFVMVLYRIVQRVAGKAGFFAGIMTIVFFLFRSGTTFFRYVLEHIQAGDLWQTLKENTAFIGYTSNENWGLWNFNVYLNQRHLAFGMLLISVAVWVFMEWLEAGDAHPEKGFVWFRRRLFSVDAWRSRRAGTAVLLGVLLGLSAFWNGAALIGGLLILCGFAIFSDGKLDYLLMAVIAVILSMLQSSFFVDGSLMSPAFYWGFLAENKSLWGVLLYLIQITGFFFLGTLVLAFSMKRKERSILLAFLFPLIFAFTVSLTTDINVNHKYVMIAYAFTSVFWGIEISGIISKIRETGQKRIKKAADALVCVILCICLTATGIYDFVIILRDNDSNHTYTVSMDSDVTSWLALNLTKGDLILTPEYSLNVVTLSGAMLYCGWPYYAWSAGYDTYYRAEKAVTIYTTEDAEELQRTVREEGITYILYEEGESFEEQECKEELIAETYTLVYTSDDGRIRIYGTYET